MDQRDVPPLRIPYDEADRAFIHDSVTDILDSGWLTLGGHTERFEEQFAEFTGLDHAVACSNGTTAIELVLRALGIEGDTVVVPTNTFIATAFAAMQTRNRVVFADADESTFALDVDAVAERLTDDTEAVIVVHVGGIITPDIEAIARLCADHDVTLIEDCAHAHGARLDGTHAGSFGVAGTFSFFPTKVLTTGEGGMVVTDDDELAETLRQFRNHGKDPDRGDRVTEFGYNHRMSEFTAVLGEQQMRTADRILEARQRVAARYDERLQAVPKVDPLPIPDGVTSSYYKYIVRLDSAVPKGALVERLAQEYGVSLPNGVYDDDELCHSLPLWDAYTYCGARRTAEQPACHQWPECGCDRRQAEFPVAERLAASHVCLPIYPGLTPAETDYVVDALGAAVDAVVEGRA